MPRLRLTCHEQVSTAFFLSESFSPDLMSASHWCRQRPVSSAS